MKTLLTIAGSDCSGGAGIQADLKTFSALHTYGMSVITAVTAQNTNGVQSVREMDRRIVAEQINCLFDDIHIDAVKIGMVSNTELIHTISACLKEKAAKNIVLDPVMVSKNGHKLLKTEATEVLMEELFPISKVVTPNLDEAEAITGKSIRSIEEMEKAAKMIHAAGSKNVVVKGGHLQGNPIDILYDGESFTHIKGLRIPSKNTHGTGCTFSSAIAAFIGRGYSVPDAVKLAKEYINTSIEHSIELGHGVGPTNHFYTLYKAAGMEE